MDSPASDTVDVRASASAQSVQSGPYDTPRVDNTDDQPDQPSPINDDGTEPSQKPPVAPMQKRRRVTRACDECRRKKIKCDGKQPCTHCTVYSYGKPPPFPPPGKWPPLRLYVALCGDCPIPRALTAA